MATKKEQWEKIKLTSPKFRVSFPKVWPGEQQDYKGDGKFKYSVDALFSKDTDLKEMKGAAFALAYKYFGKDKKKWPRAFQWPFIDGNTKSDLDGYADCVLVKFKTSAKSATDAASAPQVIKKVNGEKVRITQESGEFYAGCYARATITCCAYKEGSNSGVVFYLGNLCKIAEGKPFSSKESVDGQFDDVEDTDEDNGSDDAGNYEDVNHDDKNYGNEDLGY